MRGPLDALSAAFRAWSRSKLCPHCGVWIDRDAEVCWQCDQAPSDEVVKR